MVMACRAAWLSVPGKMAAVELREWWYCCSVQDEDVLRKAVGWVVQLLASLWACENGDRENDRGKNLILAVALVDGHRTGRPARSGEPTGLAVRSLPMSRAIALAKLVAEL